MSQNSFQLQSFNPSSITASMNFAITQYGGTFKITIAILLCYHQYPLDTEQSEIPLRKNLSMPITIVNTNYTITEVKNTTFPFAYLIKYYNMKSQDLISRFYAYYFIFQRMILPYYSWSVRVGNRKSFVPVKTNLYLSPQKAVSTSVDPRVTFELKLQLLAFSG